MTRCPLCRARYRGGELCRRCRADLSILSALEHNAAQQAYLAVQQLLAGKMDQAYSHAHRAKKQHVTRFHNHLCAFVAGLRESEIE